MTKHLSSLKANKSIGKDWYDAEKLISLNVNIPQVYTLVDNDMKTLINAMPVYHKPCYYSGWDCCSFSRKLYTDRFRNRKFQFTLNGTDTGRPSNEHITGHDPEPGLYI